jgi:large subunit ribosomal protein L10
MIFKIYYFSIMRKIDKQPFVENLTSELKSATSVVLVDYAGLSVKMQQELKARLKESGAIMTVAKNTLFRIAAKDAGYPKEVGEDTVLAGPTALVMTKEDPIAPLQVIAKFAKEFEIPQFKVGVIEGGFQDKQALLKLSTLPGKDVLFAQALGAVSAPLYGLVGTLNANVQKLLWILKSKAEQS